MTAHSRALALQMQHCDAVSHESCPIGLYTDAITDRSPVDFTASVGPEVSRVRQL
jgi:hypothetical protein